MKKEDDGTKKTPESVKGSDEYYAMMLENTPDEFIPGTEAYARENVMDFYSYEETLTAEQLNRYEKERLNDARIDQFIDFADAKMMERIAKSEEGVKLEGGDIDPLIKNSSVKKDGDNLVITDRATGEEAKENFNEVAARVESLAKWKAKGADKERSQAFNMLADRVKAAKAGSEMPSYSELVSKNRDSAQDKSQVKGRGGSVSI